MPSLNVCHLWQILCLQIPGRSHKEILQIKDTLRNISYIVSVSSIKLPCLESFSLVFLQVPPFLPVCLSAAGEYISNRFVWREFVTTSTLVLFWFYFGVIVGLLLCYCVGMLVCMYACVHVCIYACMYA